MKKLKTKINLRRVSADMRQKFTDKRLVLTSCVFSIFLSLSFVAGAKNDQGARKFNDFVLFDVFAWLILAAVLFIAFIYIFDFFRKRRRSLKSRKSGVLIWVFSSLFMLIAWFPVLLAYYPGNLSPDSLRTVGQVMGTEALSNHHPVMFTVFVKACMKFGMLFGDINFGVACFSFAQMLVMAAVFGFFIYWLAKRNLPRYVYIPVGLFFALDPVIARYAITMWKDVMFGAWMLLLVLFLYDVAASGGALLKKPRGLIFSAVLCFLLSFGRNNGIFVVIALFALLILCYRKHYKRLLPVFFASVAAAMIIQGPVYDAAGIRQSSFAESVGIPLQQIAYTVKYDGKMTPEQEEFISNMLPLDIMKEAYYPYTPDYVKFNKSFNMEFLNDNKAGFIKLWAAMLPSNLGSYVKAYLMETLGYWHIGTTNWIVDGLWGNSFGIENTDYIKKATGFDCQKIMGGGINGLRGAIIVNNIYSIAFSVWLVFFYALVMFLKKRCAFILPVTPLVALWGTMMIAAPTFCEFRYMFSFHLALPFLFITLFLENKNFKI